MVAVQAVVHIDAVAVEMEVRDAGLAVRMERDDVLGFISNYLYKLDTK